MSGPHTTMTVGSPSPCFFSRSGGAVYAADRKKPPSANARIGQPRSTVRYEHDREAARVHHERVDREAAPRDRARDHRMRRVEVARVVRGVGADLEVEEVVHEVVGHVREHETDRREREQPPVDARRRGRRRAARRGRRRPSSSAGRRRGSGRATSRPGRARPRAGWWWRARAATLGRLCGRRLLRSGSRRSRQARVGRVPPSHAGVLHHHGRPPFAADTRQPP